MARIKFYIDEDSQESGLIAALRTAGIDVQTSSEAGMNGHSDAEQFAHATSQGRTLYTRNVRDFRILVRRCLEDGREHWGVVYWPAFFSIGEQRKRLVVLWENRTAAELVNIEEFLSNWGS